MVLKKNSTGFLLLLLFVCLRVLLIIEILRNSVAQNGCFSQ